MSQVLAFGQAMIHRATRRIVGPIATIYQEDWPFQVIADDEILWRYIDRRKFEDLLSTSTLYFARPDRFTDPFEGRFSPGNAAGLSRSEQVFRSLYKIADPASEATDYIEIHRSVVFISCWHRNTRESFQMWQAYTSSPDSVVVTTSAKALRCFLPKGLMQYAIKYAPLDFPRTAFSHNSLFYYKPEEYAFEREFRLLRSPEVTEIFYPNNPDDTYRRIPIKTKKIIRRVITHPQATDETKRRVDALLREHLPCRRRSDSALET